MEKLYYMHTIDGKPASYVKGEQICYARSGGRGRPWATLATSIEQIKSEQKASIAWRRKRFNDGEKSRNDYGYVIFKKP